MDHPASSIQCLKFYIHVQFSVQVQSHFALIILFTGLTIPFSLTSKYLMSNVKRWHRRTDFFRMTNVLSSGFWKYVEVWTRKMKSVSRSNFYRIKGALPLPESATLKILQPNFLCYPLRLMKLFI